MIELSDILSQLSGWFDSADISSMLPAADTSVAGVIAVVLLGVWILTKVMRVLVGTLCVVCVLYLALKLGLGIDPLPYLIP
ncbi:MAG: hypothetical protein IJ498_05510 [Akkermansia sp.]|nr:hypothetical protein [Akkermansia sp.]